MSAEGKKISAFAPKHTLALRCLLSNFKMHSNKCAAS